MITEGRDTLAQFLRKFEEILYKAYYVQEVATSDINDIEASNVDDPDRYDEEDGLDLCSHFEQKSDRYARSEKNNEDS